MRSHVFDHQGVFLETAKSASAAAADDDGISAAS